MPTRRVNVRQRERTGSISRLPSGWYSVRVTEADATRHRLRGGPWETEDEARNALTRWMAQRIDGHDARRELGRTPLSEVYMLSIEGQSALDQSADRRTFYRGVVAGTSTSAHVGRRMMLGSRPVGDITALTLHEWRATLQATGLSPSTVAKWARHLSQCLSWAAAHGYIERNPMPPLRARGSAERNLAQRRQPRYFFTLQEMVQMAQAAWRVNTSYRAPLDVLMWSGLRMR